MTARRYTQDHEWVQLDGEIATVGITEHAQEQLGDIVFVELPSVGKQVERGGEAAVVESVKAASEVYAPLSGEITEINDALVEEPATVNSDPLGAGWFFKVKLSDRSQFDGLMDEAAYTDFVKSQG